MKRLTLLFAVLLMVAIPVMADCPMGSIYCDFHNKYAFFKRDEWPSGKHYRIFVHTKPYCEIAVPCD